MIIFQQEVEITSNSLGNPPRMTIADEPLRLAIKNSHVECAELLLKCGADPNARYFLGSELNLLSPLSITFLEVILIFLKSVDDLSTVFLSEEKDQRCSFTHSTSTEEGLILSYMYDVSPISWGRSSFNDSVNSLTVFDPFNSDVYD